MSEKKSKEDVAKDATMTFRLPLPLLERLIEIAQERKVSTGRVVREACREYAEREACRKK